MRLRLSTILYGTLQLGVLAGVIWMNEAMRRDTGSAMEGPAVGLLAIGLAAIATAIVYWTIEITKRLLGITKELPKPVDRPGAFDALRSRGPARLEDH
jgi:hypothetical protein